MSSKDTTTKEGQYKAKAATILTPLIKQIFHGDNRTSEKIHKEMDIALNAFADLLASHTTALKAEVLDKLEDTVMDIASDTMDLCENSDRFKSKVLKSLTTLADKIKAL